MGKSYGFVERLTSAYAFFSRFFLTGYGLDPVVLQVEKFLQKVCHTVTNVKDAFRAAEVHAIWDSIDQKSGGVPKIELRTFVMAVFQHKTFCRFSDLAVVTLNDVLYTDDYFKIKISCSKTDQRGRAMRYFW